MRAFGGIYTASLFCRRKTPPRALGFEKDCEIVTQDIWILPTALQNRPALVVSFLEAF